MKQGELTYLSTASIGIYWNAVFEHVTFSHGKWSSFASHPERFHAAPRLSSWGGLWQNHHLGPTRGGGRGKWKKKTLWNTGISIHLWMCAILMIIWYMIKIHTYIYIYTICIYVYMCMYIYVSDVYIQMDGTTVLKHWMVAVCRRRKQIRETRLKMIILGVATQSSPGISQWPSDRKST